jgi:hypothetical protein
MDLYAVKRDYGREVERHLDRLPEHLRTAAADFLGRFAGNCPPSGHFWDFDAGGDGYPVFDTLLASFADTGLVDERLRRAVFEGFAYTVLATGIDDLAVEHGPPSAPSLSHLSQTFLLEAERCFATLFPSDSAFRETYRKAWQDHVECLLWHQANHVAARNPYRDQDWLKTGQRWAPLKTGVAAAFCAGGREAELPALERLLDELNTLFQIRREILGVRRDASRQVHSLTIDRIAACLPNPRQAADQPEAILGALLLFEPVSGLIRDCVERLTLCRDLGQQLALVSFGPVLDRFQLSFETLDDLFSLKKGRPSRRRVAVSPSDEAHGFAGGADPGVATRIEAAEAYLLAEAEFRESWEVHRWGFLGESQLTGRVFPVGFILEMLLDSGLDLPGRLDALFSHWRAIDCRYFDEACPLPPDADSLGLMLRLLRFSANRDAHAAMIRPALDRMTANVAGDGDIPTYFTLQPRGEEPRNYFRHIAGNDCTGVKAGIVLGLLQCGSDSCRAVACRLQARLFDAVAASGRTTNAYYPPGYWLWMMFRLLDPGMAAGAPSPADIRGRVVDVLRETFDRLDGTAHHSAQQAAWLVLCRSTPAGWGDVRQDWLRTIVSSQAPDGGWAAEPVYLVPTWDNQTAWHRSRLMTTAVCHRALAHCRTRGIVR